jgi:hypothetical protein
LLVRAMAGSKVGPLPFAFMLALATEANSSLVSVTTDARDEFRPGMLSGLLNFNENPEFSIKSVEQVRNGETTTVVQYFPNFPNFRNCFSGYWRNC